MILMFNRELDLRPAVEILEDFRGLIFTFDSSKDVVNVSIPFTDSQFLECLHVFSLEV